MLGGWDIVCIVAPGFALKERSCAAILVSLGGVSPSQQIAFSDRYQVLLAARVKQELGLPKIAVGLIAQALHAKAIFNQGEFGAITFTRGMLYDPRWTRHAAAKLRAEINAPPQVWRSWPRAQKALFKNAKIGQR